MFSIKMNRGLFGTTLILAAATVASGQSNVNTALITMENGTPANPFAGPAGGSLQAGTNLTPATPATFFGPGDGSGNWIHADNFNGPSNPNLDGYHYNNINIIPAVLVNKSAPPLATNFGVTVGGEQIFMHPGQMSGNAFWTLALVIGLAAALIVAVLLIVLVMNVRRIDRSVEALLQVATDVAGNTASIPQLQATAPVLAAIADEAVVQDGYMNALTDGLDGK